MSNETDIISSREMIQRVFTNIEQSKAEQSNRMTAIWKKIVTSIHGCGPNLYDHSRIIDLKHGILLIETDHPGWNQMFQLNTKYILTGLKRYCPEMGIEMLSFYVKGTKGVIYDTVTDKTIEQEKHKLMERLEKEQKQLEKQGFGAGQTDSAESKPLPPELANLFAHLKDTMLTNSKN